MRGTDQLTREITSSLKEARIKMIDEALDFCGFDKQYVTEHINEFRVLETNDMLETQYYHKDKLLFTVVSDFHSDRLSVNIYI